MPMNRKRPYAPGSLHPTQNLISAFTEEGLKHRWPVQLVQSVLINHPGFRFLPPKTSDKYLAISPRHVRESAVLSNFVSPENTNIPFTKSVSTITLFDMSVLRFRPNWRGCFRRRTVSYRVSCQPCKAVPAWSNTVINQYNFKTRLKCQIIYPYSYRSQSGGRGVGVCGGGVPQRFEFATTLDSASSALTTSAAPTAPTTHTTVHGNSVYSMLKWIVNTEKMC